MLGSGGMGEVWLAHDVRIDREIAVKMMRGRDDPDAVARFLREARVQGRLEHPAWCRSTTSAPTTTRTSR